MQFSVTVFAFITVCADARTAFMVIGDWGYDHGVHGSIKPECQRAVAARMKQFKDQHNAQFVINVGDSFYPNGVNNNNDGQWWSKWRNIYDQSIINLPWFSVYGNHDLGPNDKWCVCGDYCAQINPGQAGWYMPGVNYIDERYSHLGVEIVALDTNYLWKGEICRSLGCDNCEQVLKDRYDSSLGLLASRIQYSSASSLLVFSHYPTDYFVGVNPDYLSWLNRPGKKIYYFGGHRHNVDDTSTHSISPNINWLSGGGGGWGCDGVQQGFLGGWIEDGGWITIEPQIVSPGECCDYPANLTNHKNANYSGFNG